MILHGDELGRSQGGNNNVYCQDNETAWMHWDLEDWQQELLAFTRRVVALRRDHPVFRRRRFFVGETQLEDGTTVAEIAWFRPDGTSMADADWAHEHARSMMVFFNGDAIPEPDRRGEKVVDDSFLVAFNAHHDTLTFTVPDEVYGDGWLVALDTADDQAGIVSVFDDATTLLPGVEVQVAGRSVVVLRRPRQGGRS
jgi:glycogen operon protein